MNDERAASVTEREGQTSEVITADGNGPKETLSSRENTSEPKVQNPRELDNARYAALTSRAHSERARSLVDRDQRCALRREVLNAEWFATTRQAQTVINQWLRQYNHIRPHHALGMRPPVPETILVNHQITGSDQGG